MIRRKQIREDTTTPTKVETKALPFPHEPLWYQLRPLQVWRYSFPIPRRDKEAVGKRKPRPGIILSRGYSLREESDVVFRYDNARTLYVFATSNPSEIICALIARQLRRKGIDYQRFAVDNSEICTRGKIRHFSVSNHNPNIFISENSKEKFKLNTICILNVKNSVITWNEGKTTPSEIVSSGEYYGDVDSSVVSSLLTKLEVYLRNDTRWLGIALACNRREKQDERDRIFLANWKEHEKENKQTLTSSYIKRGKGKAIAESSSDDFLIPKDKYLIMSDEEEGEMGNRKMKRKAANRERTGGFSDDYRVLNEDISPEARAELNRKWKEHFGEPRVRVFRTVEESDAFMDEVSKFLDDFWEEYDGRQE